MIIADNDIILGFLLVLDLDESVNCPGPGAFHFLLRLLIKVFLIA